MHCSVSDSSLLLVVIFTCDICLLGLAPHEEIIQGITIKDDANNDDNLRPHLRIRKIL
jgi:hypothetical protein